MNVRSIPLDVIDRLFTGERVRSSECSQAVFSEAAKRKVLLRVRGDSGRGFCMVVSDVFQFRSFVLEYYQVRSMVALRELDKKNRSGDLSRAEQTRLTTSGTKSVRRKVTSFIPVNVLSPLKMSYEGRDTVLSPTYDMPQHLIFPEKVVLAPDVVIIGTENYETIARISDYRRLFARFQNHPVLFVQRPLGSRNWLKEMLVGNACRYVHFGDFDWSGMRLYLSEYKSFLGDRSEFFVPDGIEVYFERRGSVKLAAGQPILDLSLLPEPGLKRISQLIMKYHCGVEEESFGASLD